MLTSGTNEWEVVRSQSRWQGHRGTQLRLLHSSPLAGRTQTALPKTKLADHLSERLADWIKCETFNFLAGKKAASAAASAAYDANIDTAVSLGWSYVERVAFQAFSEELQTAPAAAQGALGKLATLYGLTRVERGLAFFLAAGAADICHLNDIYFLIGQWWPMRNLHSLHSKMGISISPWCLASKWA